MELSRERTTPSRSAGAARRTLPPPQLRSKFRQPFPDLRLMLSSILRRLRSAAGIAPAMATLTMVAGQPLSAQTAPTAMDSLLTSFRERQSAMATPRFAASWTMLPSQFRRSWDSALVADRNALDAMRTSLTGEVMEREVMRLRFRHVWGRTTWPFFHWRETDAPTVGTDPEVEELLRELPVADPRWWTLPEHEELIAALVHERGRRMLASDSALQRGDVRWLRAEFAAARALFADPALLRHVTTRLITTHLDENDERGIDSVRMQWLSFGPDSVARHRVDSMIAASTALRAGHVIEVYRHVGGVPLEIHLLRPTAGDTVGRRPAMLWFHGGSGTTGSWSHSPGVVRALRSNGITVVAVEFRTGSRFDVGADPYEDAIAAISYVRRHAGRLALDSDRIGVAGFSSGAGLALTLGTRGTDVVRPAPPPRRRAYPAAVIVTGACVAPASPREDGYFRKMIQRDGGQPSDYSPIDLVAAGQPPTLLVHATRDEYCAFEDAQAFVERSRAAGNDISLSAVDGATHFFGFYHRPGQEQMRNAIANALAEWGWMNR
jgi:acetyl esterase/lipase